MFRCHLQDGSLRARQKWERNAAHEAFAHRLKRRGALTAAQEGDQSRIAGAFPSCQIHIVGIKRAEGMPVARPTNPVVSASIATVGRHVASLAPGRSLLPFRANDAMLAAGSGPPIVGLGLFLWRRQNCYETI
jgi:hypothetical protein